MKLPAKIIEYHLFTMYKSPRDYKSIMVDDNDLLYLKKKCKDNDIEYVFSSVNMNA